MCLGLRFDQGLTREAFLAPSFMALTKVEPGGRFTSGS
jgi:hypothetical protein